MKKLAPRASGRAKHLGPLGTYLGMHCITGSSGSLTFIQCMGGSTFVQGVFR